MRPWPCVVLVALLLLSPLLTALPNHYDGATGPRAPMENTSQGASLSRGEGRIGRGGLPSSTISIGGDEESPKPLPRPARYEHEGDLIIDEYQAFTGEDVYVRGNIIIKGSGMLFLTSVVLFINQSYAYQYGIYIMDSGLLNAWYSRIYSNYPFNITCEDGASLDALSTRLECTVSCKDHATVILKDSTAFMVSCYGGSTELRDGTSAKVVLAFSGSVEGAISVSPGWLPRWSLSENTSITGAPFAFEVENATIEGWFFCLGGSANITIHGSDIAMANCRCSASLNMWDTVFGSVICSGSSSARLSNCSGSILSCMNFTHVEVSNSDLGISMVLEGLSSPEPLVFKPGEVEELVIENGLYLRLSNTYVRSWDIGLVDSQLDIEGSSLTGLSCYGSTNVEIHNTTILHVHLEGLSKADIYMSSLSSITCRGSSRLRLFGTTFLPLVDVGEGAEVLVFWYLDITTTLAKEPVSEANVAVYFANSSLADQKTTGPDGLATFLLMEKLINSTGEWPLGAYHVVATYGAVYEEEADVELTDNRALTLELGFELRVKCVDGDGDVIPGALVVAGGLSASTGPDGWALIDGLRAVDTTVEVFVWGVKVGEAKLIWGSNFTGDVVIESLECAVYDMAVFVQYEDGSPAVKALVTLLWLNETSIMTLATNSTGWAVFENIPAGAYRVKAVKEGYEDVKINVLLEKEGQVVQITLKPAKPGGEGEGPEIPWNILTYALIGSMAFIIVVAIIASFKRRKRA